MNELTAFHGDIKNILKQARGKTWSAVSRSHAPAWECIRSITNG